MCKYKTVLYLRPWQVNYLQSDSWRHCGIPHSSGVFVAVECKQSSLYVRDSKTRFLLRGLLKSRLTKSLATVCSFTWAKGLPGKLFSPWREQGKPIDCGMWHHARDPVRILKIVQKPDLYGSKLIEYLLEYIWNTLMGLYLQPNSFLITDLNKMP